MSYSDHSFDWRGFGFAAMILAGFLFFAAVAQYAYPSVEARFATKSDHSATIPRALDSVESRINTSSTSSLESLVHNLSTTTPKRVINMLTIADVVPSEGKFIAADLEAMKLYTYLDGTTTAEYVIRSKGKAGTPWETPAGYYQVHTMEENHFSTVGKVYMPYSMQFYGNYFIHGWPYYPGGSPVASAFSGGCIRLSTEDAGKVFAFAEKGTGLFVYDPKRPSATTTPTIALSEMPMPSLSSASYIIADMDSGDVYVEHNASEARKADSITNMMTALVANENITFDKKITLPEGDLLHPEDPRNNAPKKILVGDTLYPFLMESKDAIARSLASYHGKDAFVNSMNAVAHALDMQSTHFASVQSGDKDNTMTTDDAFRLAVYLANKKSFVWTILRTPQKKVVATDGTSYEFFNANELASMKTFAGSSVGIGATSTNVVVATSSESTATSTATLAIATSTTPSSAVSLFTIPMKDKKHRVAVVVLQSDDYAADTKKLIQWFTLSAERAGAMAGTACASCAKTTEFRKINIDF